MEYLVNGKRIIISHKEKKLYVELLKNNIVRCYFEKVNEKLISIYPKRVHVLPKIEKQDNKIIIYQNQKHYL